MLYAYRQTGPDHDNEVVMATHYVALTGLMRPRENDQMNWFSGVTPQPNVSYYTSGDSAGNTFSFGDAGTSVQVAYDQQPSQVFQSSPYSQASSWAYAPQTSFSYPSFSGSFGGDMFGGSSLLGGFGGGLGGFSGGFGSSSLLGGLGSLGGGLGNMFSTGLSSMGGFGSSGLSTASIWDSIKGLSPRKDGSTSTTGSNTAAAPAAASGGLDIGSLLKILTPFLASKSDEKEEETVAAEEAPAQPAEAPAKSTATASALGGISEALSGLKDVVASLKDLKTGKSTAKSTTNEAAADEGTDTTTKPPTRGTTTTPAATANTNNTTPTRTPAPRTTTQTNVNQAPTTTAGDPPSRARTTPAGNPE
jgi:hypothetical protein